MIAFENILFGHLMGDYLLQNRKMAKFKMDRDFNGIKWCSIHSVVYTLSICLFCQRIDLIFFWLIFFTHWPIDRWSLGQKWLDLIDGRNYVKAYLSKSNIREINIVFSCIVYTVTDNTIHLLLIRLVTILI